MTQYSTLNVKLCNPQLKKLKFAITNGTGVILNPSSGIASDSNDENNFPYPITKNSITFNRKCTYTIS